MGSFADGPETSVLPVQIKASHHGLPHKLPPHQHYMHFDEFQLESGETLVRPTVAFTFMGMLNASRSNAVLICHALSGSSVVEDWWSSLLGSPHPALDPAKYCIICCNCLGSPYGSSSPLTFSSQDSKSGPGGLYGPNFPRSTFRDDVRIHKKVLDALGVRSLACVIGCSMGGMAALEWSLLFGTDYVHSLVLIATAARQSAWAGAWAENQRRTIHCDPKYRDGLYSLQDPPIAGLAAARMAALLSYRTHKSFELRFGNGKRRDGQVALTQSYLKYQGDKFNERFDANCYMHILDKIDNHDMSRGRCSITLPEELATAKVLSEILQPTLVIGIPSDGLYPICEQKMLYDSIPNAAFATLQSEDGHDGFLLEAGQLNSLLHLFLG